MATLKSFNYLYQLLLAFLACLLVENCSSQEINDDCDNGKGECKLITECPKIALNFERLFTQNKIKFCKTETSLICCPKRAKPIVGPRVEDTRLFITKCAEFHKQLPCLGTTPLIVAGTKAEPKEFPHMALFGVKGTNNVPNWVCGGTLISNKYVITAAHCLRNLNISDIAIRLGELDYSRDDDDAQPQDFNITNFIVNPHYSNDFYDIALLELDHEVKFNDYIQPACLPWDNDNDFEDFLATGWGSIGHAKEKSSHLLKVSLNRFEDFECTSVRQDGQFDDRTQLCAGSRTDNSDTCQGDSGGPIFVKHPQFSCLYVLIGITSTGRICGLMDLPAIYTRVNLFVPWIEQIVWDAKTPL